MTAEILFGLGALGMGIMVGLLMANRGKSEMAAKMATLEEKNNALRLAGAQLETRHQEEMQQVKEAHRESLAEKDEANRLLMEQQDKRHEQAIEGQQQLFDQTVALLRQQVQTATDEMLKERQKEFAESSNKELDPLRESIKEMQEAMTQNKNDQRVMSAEIKSHMEQIVRQSEAAQNSAEELTRAFKHKSKVQGDWGEVVLNELLESQGLVKGVNFIVQSTLKDADGNTIRPDEGNNLRPDVLLNLDENRQVVIDSKVSLSSYIDYANADDEETRRNKLREHVVSLRRHVEELARKDYSSYTDSQIDFVIMFVPHTMALVAATNEDPRLWRDAMDQKVFIVDEQTLYAALRIIKLTWTHIEQEQNHQKLYEAASTLLDRVGHFLQSYDSIGEALKKVQKQYEEGERMLSDHGQSIPVAANNLIKLGAKNKKSQHKIPAKYMEEKLLSEDSGC